MEHEEQTISSLSTGDKLLLVGHLTSSVSILLIGVGSIIKAAGRLPSVTIGTNQQTQSQQQTTKKGYFDLN